MKEKLNPKALAQSDTDDDRPGTQVVDQDMIQEYAVSQGLPPVSADPFAEYLYQAWFDYEDPERPAMTNNDVIQGALAFWRGQ